VYVPDEDALYFTTLPRFEHRHDVPFPAVSIKRLALDGERFPLEPERVSVVREHTRAANGMTLDPGRGLIVCEQGTYSDRAAISRLELNGGELRPLLEEVEGHPLNSPNDVAIMKDGTIWFTDPSYGHLQGFKPEPQLADRVYRYDPRSGVVTAVTDSIDKPNGLVFSPDERTLYVGDSGANRESGSFYPELPHEIRAFDVVAGCRLENERTFATVTPGYPDGLKVDDAGRVYASSFSGVQVFTPDGDLIGEIPLPGVVNFAWGGKEKTILFITRDNAVWAAEFASRAPRSKQQSSTGGE
jgi:gluconolactonase